MDALLAAGLGALVTYPFAYSIFSVKKEDERRQFVFITWVVVMLVTVAIAKGDTLERIAMIVGAGVMWFVAGGLVRPKKD